ncbi:hypothetical protein [Sphingomonas glacialis]|uniref:Uncharacterized protein n=1 Tax=Sphingomonas glacialis TaxID=658225 RepID=A0A502FT84_9SPHN|nr:hypothetical protein [Sphingomonas glacialis]TPG52664.1 hypothetical protein EAH76_12325 [Sphingomonas glacialis]
MHRLNVALTGLLFTLATPALARSSIDGTWKADTTTAKLSTKPDIFVIKDGMYDCSSCAPPYKIAADGKVHPVAGRDYWDAGSVALIDPATLQWTRYRKGVSISSTKVAVSPDGNTLTFTSVSADNALGKSIASSSLAKRVGPAPAGAHATSGSWVGINEGAQIAEENLVATISMVDDVVTMTLGTGEHYAAKLDGPQTPFVGDKAGAMVALKRAGTGFVETDYVNGTAIGTYTYIPQDETTMTMKAFNMKAGTTEEYTLKKQ